PGHAARTMAGPRSVRAAASPAAAGDPRTVPGTLRQQARPTHGVSRPARRARPGAPHVRLDAAPHDGVAAAGRSAPSPARRASPNASSSGEGGFNVGWLLACIGLVAAACALGRPDGARAVAVRGRDAFVSLVRPL